ncbi:MAG: hypothetical protein ABF296_04865, partial [Oceanococcaceae bacterium]
MQDDVHLSGFTGDLFQCAAQFTGISRREKFATTGLGHALQLAGVGIAQIEAHHVQPKIDAGLLGRLDRLARIAAAGFQTVGNQ